MNLRTKYSRKSLALLVCLFAWALVACSGAGNDAEPGALPAGSDATPPPPVAYGSSLDQWSEAVAPSGTESANAGSSNFPDPIVPVTSTVTVDPFAGALIENAAGGDATPAGEVTATAAATTTADIQLTSSGDLIYQELFWDALVPADYTPEAIMAKYADELAQIVDGSPEASELYARMQAEFNNAPINEALDGAFIKLPGFIAPLEFTDNEITEFLLVPYFGACIHVPPPPINQTVLVRLQPGFGINPADAYYPIWVMGQITTEKSTTELASAGYTMQDAIYELYEPE